MNFIINALIGVALSIVVALLTYSSLPFAASTQDDVKLPNATPGTEIPRAYGRVILSQPQDVWHGDFRRSAVRRSSFFGLVRNTVAENIYLGIHFVLARELDEITEVFVDRRSVWFGSAADETITIDRTAHLGGSTKGGGIRGPVDIMMGLASQGQNTYLASILGMPVPAFRGVVSAVLNHLYLGESPVLTPWAFKGKRFETQPDGSAQWYPEKVRVQTGFEFERAASDSVRTMIPGLGPIPTTPAESWDELTWRSRATLSTAALTSNGLDGVSIIGVEDAFVIGLPSGPSVYRVQAHVDLIQRGLFGYSDLTFRVRTKAGRQNIGGASFHAASLQIISGPSKADLLTGQGTVIEWESADVAAAVPSEFVDIDSGDITITPGQGAVMAVLVGGRGNVFADTIIDFDGSGQPVAEDMNAAHALRELVPGTPGNTFTDAADTLFAEGLGVSFLHDTPSDTDEIRRRLEEIIDGMVYQDRLTGNWEIELFRPTYGDGSSLPLFDTSNVAEWGEQSRPDRFDLPNQVTVVYTDYDNLNTNSITIGGGPRRSGRSKIVNRKLEYPEINSTSVADTVGGRRLQALSAGLLEGWIRVPYLSRDLHRGSAIRLSNDRIGIQNLVARISRIEDGNQSDTAAIVWYIEDRDLTKAQPLVADTRLPTPSLSNPPSDAPYRFVEEMSYWALVSATGQSAADAQLLAAPDQGYIHATADSPTDDAAFAELWINGGGGYQNAGQVDFCPALTLSAAVSGDPSIATLQANWNRDIDQIELPTLATIGGEWIYVTSIISDVGAGTATITAARAVLDTLAEDHDAGAALLFWPGYAGSDGVTRGAGSSVDVRMLTETALGTLALSDATEETVLMEARAVRPFRPGRLRLAGTDAPDEIADGDPLTWLGRNRLTEANGTPIAYAATTDETPETGTTYRLDVIGLSPAGAELGPPHFSDANAISPYSMVEAAYLGGLPVGATQIRISVTAVRDGFDSWRSPAIDVSVAGSISVTGDSTFITGDSTIFTGDRT